MDSILTATSWQNNKLNSKHLISFVVSSIIIFLILLIPFASYNLITQQTKKISIQLIKSKAVNKQIVNPEPVQPILEPKPIKTSKPVEQKKPKILKEKPNTTRIVHRKPKVLKAKVITHTQKLPSAGAILNSLKNRRDLPVLDKDFQTSSNVFITQSLVAKKETKLVANKKFVTFNISETKPIGVKVLKALASQFSLFPIDDKVKTQDMLPYCFNLGRRSSYCPTSNPLEN